MKGQIVYTPKPNTKAYQQRRREIVMNYNDRIAKSKSSAQKFILFVRKQFELLKNSAAKDLYVENKIMPFQKT